MNETNTVKPRKKFDLLTLIIISAFIGVLCSITAITIKRLNPAATTLPNTFFFVGLGFAVPAVFYITYYIIIILSAKTPDEYKEQMKKERIFRDIRDSEGPRLEPEYREIDEVAGHVAKEAMNARIREVERQLKRPTYEDDMYDIYADEDEYAREVPRQEFFVAPATHKAEPIIKPAAAPVRIAPATEPKAAAPKQPAVDADVPPMFADPIKPGERIVPVVVPDGHTVRVAPPPRPKTEEDLQKIRNKKLLFTQENLERYLRIYFVETASCFLMDRDKYIDYFGIAPYNKITIRPSTVPGIPDEVSYAMTATKQKLYKFAAILVDLERFITHEQLYHNFISSIESGKSLVRISEQLHKLYRKLYKSDFINNYTNKEDFDNMLILVSNNYILGNNDFRNIFTKVPFEIPAGWTEDNIVRYLSNPALKEKFTEAFPNYGDIGFDSVWDAIYICFINSIKGKLTTEQLESAVTSGHKKISRALAREDKKQQKELAKAMKAAKKNAA